MPNYLREARQSRKDLPGVTANSLPGLLGPLFWAWGEVEYRCCVVEGAAHLMEPESLEIEKEKTGQHV